MKYAAAAEVLQSAFAQVGIIALIDEALGYENLRKRTLREMFDAILEEEYHAWARQFDLEYYEGIYRLRGQRDIWENLLRTARPGKKPQAPS